MECCWTAVWLLQSTVQGMLRKCYSDMQYYGSAVRVLWERCGSEARLQCCKSIVGAQWIAVGVTWEVK